MKKEMIIPFFLACAVVLGALWAFSEFGLHESNRNQNATGLQTKDYPSQSLLQQVRPSDPRAVGQEDRSIQGQVIKCVLNGKTIYSDEKCPAGAKTHQVQLYDTAGVVSPPKAVLSELTAQRIATENAQVQSLQQPVALPVQSKKIECDAIDKHIEWLDSMARQPQSAQRQDWIRQERSQARDRQFGLHC